MSLKEKRFCPAGYNRLVIDYDKVVEAVQELKEWVDAGIIGINNYHPNDKINKEIAEVLLDSCKRFMNKIDEVFGVEE